MAAEPQDIENKFFYLFLEGWLAEKFVYRFKITFALLIQENLLDYTSSYN